MNDYLRLNDLCIAILENREGEIQTIHFRDNRASKFDINKMLYDMDIDMIKWMLVEIIR